MRDIFLVICFPLFIWLAMRSPYTALYFWLWTSMFPLRNWVYGIAIDIRFNFIFAFLTILGYFIKLKDKPEFKTTSIFILVLLFYFHCLIGVLINSATDYHTNQMAEYSKALVFFIFCVLMLRSKEHYTAVLTFISISLCYFGLMEGLKYISTGGAHTIYGMRGPLGDNNKVALGLNMCVPLLIYLISAWEGKKIFKYYFAVLSVICIVAILGTGSRGGLLALLFLGVYYWWINGKKLYIPIVLLLIGLVVLNFMPSDWLERMQTIQEAGSDKSFLHRVTFWQINFLAAIDNPVWGLSFDSTASRNVWLPYAHEIEHLDWGVTTEFPEKGFVAHSIYFQILGNQGFVGLFIFLSILLVSFRTISQMCKKVFKKSDWQYKLLMSCKVSLVAFCVGGSALNAVYFEFFYFLLAIVITIKISSSVKKTD